MSKIVLEHIDKYYGENHVLRDINLTIEDGDFMTLLGPSGCGKTTTLRVISGLEKPQNGVMTMDGNTIIDAETAFYEAPSKRGLNLVFQSYALWPHMTTFENVAFGLKIKKMHKHEIEEKVMNALKLMRIEEYRDRYPNELSGGQQQRVAIARAIATSPKLLLLYVTHDQVEALTMSTKIALFKEGEIAQVDTPLGLYTNPIDLTAADFIGNPRINFVDGVARFDGSELTVTSDLGKHVFPKSDVKLDEEIPLNEDFPCVLGIRPELVELETEPHEHPYMVAANVYASQPAGSETLISLTVGKAEFLAIQLGLADYEMNQTVYAVLHPERMNVYNKNTGRLIKFAYAAERKK